MAVTPDDVARAADRRTPDRRAHRRSSGPRGSPQRYAAEVLLKREDQQVGRSYKVRGAFNLMASLTADELALGVVCASAGNHAQGVALSCSRLGADGHIFLPTNTPRQKRDRIRELGGARVTMTMQGRTYDDASTGRAPVRRSSTAAPTCTPSTTSAPSPARGPWPSGMTRDADRPLDVVVIPVGGGGLLAGMATWLRQPGRTPASSGSSPRARPA